jgi:DNA-binding NarL/FixJ family response regulator
MASSISVAILDDHQSIVDGYRYRLGRVPGIDVVGAITYADELEPLLASTKVDLLLLDLSVPTSADNPNPYPVLHLIPKLQERYPDLHMIIISMHCVRPLINKVMDAGLNGYILKDDMTAIQNLGKIIESVVTVGSLYLSPQVKKALNLGSNQSPDLTPRQLEVLSLCAAYPNETTAQLANRLHLADSTVRNLLSGVYERLEVSNRTAAVMRARDLGLVVSSP